MVGISNFITSQLLNRLVEGSFAHLGTEGAGIAFLPNMEHHVIDLGLYNRIPHAQFITERLNRAQVKIREAQIYGNSLDFKFFLVKALKSM